MLDICACMSLRHCDLISVRANLKLGVFVRWICVFGGVGGSELMVKFYYIVRFFSVYPHVFT
jgi:hypothetical protein